MQLVLGQDGILTPITSHVIPCILCTLNVYPRTCDCTQMGKQYNINLVTQQHMTERLDNSPSTSDEEEEPGRVLTCFGAKLSVVAHVKDWNKKQKLERRKQEHEEEESTELTNDKLIFIMAKEDDIEKFNYRSPMTSPDGWQAVPYSPKRRYPWITKAEMDEIKEWMKNVPHSGGRRFLVHPLNTNGLSEPTSPTGLLNRC